MSFSGTSIDDDSFSITGNRMRMSTKLFLTSALVYSCLLFFIANYLPLLTNGAAQILTWVVYARIVRGVVIFLAALLLYIVYIRWPLVPRRGIFLLQLLPFVAVTAWFFGRLGESVNEYIHYPQYATCVLLWHTALNRMGRDWKKLQTELARRLQGSGPLKFTVALSALLGIAEEGYQYIAPRRAFDLQDIALNMMGVWLGVMLVWILNEHQPSAMDSRRLQTDD